MKYLRELINFINYRFFHLDINMFSTSTQKQNWLFKDANQIADLRKKANENYIRRQNVDVGLKFLFIKNLF